MDDRLLSIALACMKVWLAITSLSPFRFVKPYLPVDRLLHEKVETPRAFCSSAAVAKGHCLGIWGVPGVQVSSPSIACSMEKEGYNGKPCKPGLQ